MQELALKYNLPYIQVISNWVRTCLSPEEIQNKRLSLPPETQKIHLCPKKGNFEGFDDISTVTTYPRS